MKASAGIFLLEAFLMAFLAASPPAALAGVSVYDDVVLAGEPFMLAARTSRAFLAQGGEMVEFAVDGKSLGRTLSGGDGMAYLEYRPISARLYVVEAVYKAERARGHALAVGRSEAVVVVDVEGAVFESFLSRTPRDGAREAIGKMMKKSPVIYASTALPGREAAKALLVKAGMPEGLVMGFEDGGFIEYLQGLGIPISAFIAGEGSAEYALADGVRTICFTEVEGAEEAGSWEQAARAALKGRSGD